jgi:tetratricopeptide (TPR) repeat protein
MSVESQKPSPGASAGRRLALLVGVNGPPAPGRAPLQYAADDGRDMAQVLQQKCCGFELFRPALLGEQATTAQVKNAVIKLAQGIQSDDSILFFFSGHAEALPIGADLDEVYLVTDDFDRDDVEIDKDSHVSLRWLRQILFEHKKARSVLLILDCCYAGKFADSAPDPYFETLSQRLRFYFGEPGAQSPSRPGGVRLALTATGDSVAKEQDGHGLLTGHLLKALQGDCEQAANERGEITFTSLFGYLKAAMPDQSPRFFGAGDDLLLATRPHLSAQQRREREQQAQQAEREQRLRALAADPGRFLQDRLEGFVGRKQELEKVRQYIQALLPTGGYLAITGVAGQGKSSLIARLVQEEAQAQGGIEQVVYHFIPPTPGAEYQAVLLRKLMARLILKHQLSDVFLEEQASTATLSAGFHWMLAELARQGKHEIIFIDGLDQLRPDQQTGWRDLSFLPQGPDLPPPGIVFVLGTRPDDTRRPLESLKPFQEYPLPGLSRPDFDRVLQHRNVTTLEAGLASRLHETLKENALYLDLVAQELAKRPSLTPEEVEQIVQQLAENPENLFALSIERLRWQKSLWEAVLKPILGLLSVTREPLCRDHLKRLLTLARTRPVDGEQVDLGLQGLGGLIVLDNQQRYSLFHLKFRDYLLQDKQQPQKKYLFDLEDQQHQHERFVTWCEQHGLDEIWKDTPLDLAEQERRRYARQHYITHLYEADQLQQLFKVLDEGRYGKAKVASDPSTRLYALDLDLGRKAAASSRWNQKQAIAYLPALWRYTLLRCSLASRADRYPEEAFEAMLWLGQEAKARGLAELLTEPAYQARIFLLMARRLREAPGREREARQMFLRVEQVIATLPEGEDKAWALRRLAAALAQAGERQRAERHWQRAEQVIAMLPEGRNKAVALRELAAALVQAGAWSRAEQVIATLPEGRDKAWALSGLAAALGQAGERQRAERHWQEAEQVIATLPEGEDKARAVRELAAALAQAGERQRAEWYWQQAEQVIATIPEGWDKARAVQELAAALAQAGEWSQAEQVIATLPEGWDKAVALQELAAALAQAGERQRAERHWQQAEQVIATLPEGEDKAVALRELAAALAQAGERQRAEWYWQQAEQVIATLPEGWNKAGALQKLAAALAQAGEWSQAEQVIATLPEGWDKAGALRELAAALAQAGEWSQAEQVIATLPEGWDKARAVRELAAALAQAGEWSQAEQVIATLPEGWDKAGALQELAAALAQAGERQRAERHWQQAEQVIATLPEGEDKAVALRELAAALAQAGEWSQAEQVIATLPEGRNKAWAVSELAAALAHAGAWSRAEQVIATLPEGRNKAGAVSELAAALAQAGERQRAERHWQEAEQVIATILEEWDKAGALQELAAALAQAGEGQRAEWYWQEAEQVIATILEEWDKVEALSELAAALAHAGAWSRAEQVIATLPEKWAKAGVLRELAAALAHAGERQRAEWYWQEAEQVIATILEEWDKVEALSELAAALAHAGEWSQAEQVIATLPEGDKAWAVRELAAALAQQNKEREVVRLIQREWSRTTRRDEALNLLPLAFGLFRRHPELGPALFDAFAWVDAFLQPSPPPDDPQETQEGS